MNKDLMERTLKWARTEDEQRDAGGDSAWDQWTWAAVPKVTERTVRGSLTESSRDRLAERSQDWGGELEFRVAEVSCGTAMCLAGYAATLEGARLLVDQRSVEGHADGCRYPADFVLTPDGDIELVATFAQRMLGLTDNQASRLFAGSSSYESVESRARMIAAEHGQVLAL